MSIKTLTCKHHVKSTVITLFREKNHFLQWIFIFAIIAIVRDTTNWIIWPTLALFFIAIQLITAYAWYAIPKYGWVFSLIGAGGILAITWQTLSLFGVTSWVY